MYIKTRIRWIMDLNASGKLLGFVATSSGGTGKKDRGKEFEAPHVGRASGVAAKLLADNAEYLLGIRRAKSKPDRVAECHQDFVNLVRACAESTGEPTVNAVLTFLQQTDAKNLSLPQDFDPTDILTFRVDGQLPIELDSVKHFWASRSSVTEEGDGLEQKASAVSQCLICGRSRPAVKRLPFKIKRIPGGQTSGNALISANVPAFESYGLEASLIAPTCQECGERFSKALNSLIEGAPTHIAIDPILYVFWTKEEAGFNVASLLQNPEPEEVKELIGSVFGGKAAAVGLDLTPFYAAALSASGARVAVRDWIDTTLGNAKRNISRYFVLQRIVDRDGSEGRPIGLYALAASTVRDARRELPPNVPKVLLNTALKGGPLPTWLLYEAVKRNRAEQGVTRPRAALIKMVLLSQSALNQEENMEQLDTGNTNPGYICGRLMGVLEAVQRAAMPGVNATITDRFFGTASSAPASVFPRLVRGAQAHLTKLRKEKRGAFEASQRRLEEVMAQLPSFPRVLTLEEQGLFSLGYYHQCAADRADRAAAIAAKAAKEVKETAHQEGGETHA
jgi:CRISPR-associated protein Csd1